jgi:hypothetical protein
MGIQQQSDINVISPENTSIVPLAGNGIFTGTFVRVMDYTSVAVTIATDVASVLDGLQLQWSQDGLTEELNLRQSYDAGDRFADGRVRAPFFRVVYFNGPSPQGFFNLTTILRKGTPSGSIIPVGNDVNEDSDAQVVQAVLVAPRLDLPSDLVRPRSSGDPFLYVIPPPNQTTFVTQTVFATTAFSPQLDFFGLFGNTRRFFTVFNNTIRGNLYIKLGGAASVSPFGYDYKVPPQGTWELPSAWRRQGGTIFGIWDYSASGGEAM